MIQAAEAAVMFKTVDHETAVMLTQIFPFYSVNYPKSKSTVFTIAFSLKIQQV